MSDPLLPDEFDAVLRDSLRERAEAAPISRLAEKAIARAAAQGSVAHVDAMRGRQARSLILNQLLSLMAACVMMAVLGATYWCLTSASLFSAWYATYIDTSASSNGSEAWSWNHLVMIGAVVLLGVLAYGLDRSVLGDSGSAETWGG